MVLMLRTFVITMWSHNPTLDIDSKELRAGTSQRCAPPCSQQPKDGNNPGIIRSRMEKENVVETYNGILMSFKEEGNFALLPQVPTRGGC